MHKSGDLAAAYDAIRGLKHWFAEVCKARVRLLQYRLDEAEQHLKAAMLGSLEEDIELTPYHAGLADLWKFELDWLRGKEPQRGFAIDPLLDQVTLQRNAFIELRWGSIDSALQQFRDAERSARNGMSKATCKVGQALCFAALGYLTVADDCLFFAADYAPQVRSRLYKAQLWIALAMTWHGLGDDDRRDQCLEAINRLAVPYTTKDCLLTRYKVLFAMSQREEKLVILV